MELEDEIATLAAHIYASGGGDPMDLDIALAVLQQALG
jgi:hypothetical protein